VEEFQNLKYSILKIISQNGNCFLNLTIVYPHRFKKPITIPKRPVLDAYNKHTKTKKFTIVNKKMLFHK